jgi:hypothetical protein
MPYVLQIRALGAFPRIEIDKSRFIALKNARKVLTAALSFEEIYEILISNYLSLEQRLVTQAASNMVYERWTYSDFFEMRLSFNTAFANLMTSARLFVDQVSTKAAACAPSEQNASETIVTLMNAKFDASKSYRFMEALRNHVQHAGPPVDSVRFGAERRVDDNYSGIVYYTEVTASKAALAENGRFKKSILDESPEDIDLIAATREYIEALSDVHMTARRIASGHVAEARKTVELAVEEYRAAYGKDPVGLNATAEGPDGPDHFPMLLQWDDVRKQLERRNSNLVSLSKRFVSSRSRRS